MTNLDDNQKFDVLRRSVIFMFCKGDKIREQYGLSSNDFTIIMKFLSELYYSYGKLKEKSQCLNQ